MDAESQRTTREDPDGHLLRLKARRCGTLARDLELGNVGVWGIVVVGRSLSAFHEPGPDFKRCAISAATASRAANTDRASAASATG